MSHRRQALVAAGLALWLAGAATAGCGTAKPNASAGTGGASCGQQATAGSYTVTLTPATCPPAAKVRSRATISVKDAQGNALVGATVVTHTDMEKMEMPSGTTTASPNGDSYQVDLALGMPGEWIVRVTVTPSGGAEAEARFQLTVK